MRRDGWALPDLAVSPQAAVDVEGPSLQLPQGIPPGGRAQCISSKARAVGGQEPPHPGPPPSS